MNAAEELKTTKTHKYKFMKKFGYIALGIFLAILLGLYLSVKIFWPEQFKITSFHESFLKDLTDHPDTLMYTNLNSYESAEKALAFKYNPIDRVYEDQESITVVDKDVYAKDIHAASIVVHSFENIHGFSPRMWWLVSSIEHARFADMLLGTERQMLKLNGQSVYVVIPRKLEGNDPIFSSYLACGDKICEVASPISPLFVSHPAYKAILLTLQSYRKDPMGGNNADIQGLIYTSKKFGYEIWHPEQMAVMAPEREAPASDDDPYVDLGGYMHIRVLLCTFSSDERMRSLDDYLSGGSGSDGGNTKTTLFGGGGESLESVSKVEFSGAPSVNTYISDKNQYRKSVYIKRNKILYVLSLPMYPSNQSSMNAEELFDTSVASFQALPLANEAELSSDSACSMTQLSESGFYRNRYTVQFVPSLDRGNFSDAYRLKGVHADTFEILNGSYGKDNEAAFYKSERIPADVGTFEILNEYYAKDKNFVYYDGKSISEADPETLRVDKNDPHVARDKRTRYEYGCDTLSPSWKDGGLRNKYCGATPPEEN